MKRSGFTDEQIIAIVKEQEAGAKTADVCRRHGLWMLLGSPFALVWIAFVILFAQSIATCTAGDPGHERNCLP
jgi:hypothetical protein